MTSVRKKQHNMFILTKRLSVLFFFLCFVLAAQAQKTENSNSSVLLASQSDSVPDIVPVISYNTPRKYEIADIKITGLQNKTYDDFALIGFSGLTVGDVIEVPGVEPTNAVKRFWKQGLFSDIKLYASKIHDNKIWIEIVLKERPLISEISFTGVKKNERKELEGRMGMPVNTQITPNRLDRAKKNLKKYFDEKGFNQAEVKVKTVPDLSKENHVILNIDIIKKNKTKVNKIVFEGNKQINSTILEKAMKKTRQKNTFKAWFRNFLRSTKYTPENYEADKANIISKYNELGYRDANIVWDSVYSAAAEGKPDKMDIIIKIDEGDQYFLRKINWIGNTEVSTNDLQRVLNMKSGDVYNQKKLMSRLSLDEDAVMNIFYQNQGYLFSHADPVEINLDKDSVDLEIRITENSKATIRKVNISGNDRLYEDVIRRELRVKPGALYSRDDIMRSLREVAQMGHFDPENLQPKIEPDPDNGTVDISLPLVSKANDQVEFSAGWGQTGLIGKLSLKFTNFSIKNLFNPSSYKGIIPQGDGQTLTLSAQTNAKYYQSYSLSFLDPWFGGKRPNSLSVGLYYSKQTAINSNYLRDSYYSYGPNSGYYPNSGIGNNYDYALDPHKSIQMMGVSVGYGKRLEWPDDYFYLRGELAYQLYKMKDWQYFMVKNGTCNSISLNLTLGRSSIDNPIYTRSGTDFAISVQATPPFSLWDGKNYKDMKKVDQYFESSQKYRWIEYHKWKFKAKTFTSLVDQNKLKRTPVLMTRTEFGLIGYYNSHKKSPFETFYVGGDGMSGYSSTYATETIGLRGYENGSLGAEASAYARLGLELRFPLILEPTSTIYILGFVEGGNAWNDIKDFNPFELKRSAGFGARIMLPMIGLMGIDWAYGFDPVNGSRSSGGSQFHFILGQEF